MPDDNNEMTMEERYAPKLPKQLREQVDFVNGAIEQALAPEQPQDDGQDDDQDDSQEFDAGDGRQEDIGEFDDSGGGEDWEQRLRSTHGRLEQALTNNQNMARRISELEDQISSLRVQSPQAPAPAPSARKRLVTDEEIGDFGEEFFTVVGKRARDELLPEIDPLVERIKRLEAGQQAVGQVVQRSQTRGVYDLLSENVPNWRDINHSAEFANWLDQPDFYSGRTKRELLTDAFSRHDERRVLNFFQGFLTEAVGTPPNASSPGSAAPPLTPPNGRGNGSGRPSLEDFAAPGRARSAPQQLPPDKPVYNDAWIAKFSEEKRRGLWRGREAEVEAIERDIFQAQHEGRYHPN